jgi:uncharacterized protein (UPF0276 family)
MFDVPALGHGIGLRPTHYATLIEQGACGATWFEAISENFFELGGRPLAVLERVRRDVPVVLHGVGMGLGSTEPPSAHYLSRLQALAERIQPAWVSDHVCWGSADGHFSHDLLPLPRCEETLALMVERVDRVQHTLGRPLILENITAYLGFRRDHIPESEFLNELTRRSGAGLLLDVNNVYVNSENLGFDPCAFLDALAPESVAQIHLAGHTRNPDFILDSHVGPVPEPVWQLYRRAVQRFGRVPTLIEWDEDVPVLDAVLAEAELARSVERDVLGS